MAQINKLIKYYFYQLFNSIVFIIFGVIAIIGAIITVILPYYLRSEFLSNSSFIISIIFQVILLFILLYISTKLFNENKYNLSDIKLLGKNFFRSQMFWAKTLVIIIASTVLIVAMSVLATFTMLGLHVNGVVIAAIFVSNLIGLFIDILVFAPILIIMSLLLGRIYSPIISLLVILICPITSCIGNFLLSNKSECNSINKNINDTTARVQYDKIYQFNSSNKLIDYVYAYNYNYDQAAVNNINTDIANSINYVNKFNFLMPGEITIATQQAIYSQINNQVNLSNYLMYSGSLAKYVPSNFKNLSNYLNTNNSYILTNLNDNDFFAKNAIELTQMLLDSVQNVVNNNSSIALNSSEVSGIYNSLVNNEGGLWNFDKLNQKQIDFIFDLLGSSDSNLFYVWYYNQYLSGNITDIIGLISEQFSPELSQLINYLWFNNDTYFNLIIINSSNAILNEFKTKLRSIYPINSIYKSTNLASEKDLNFFANQLVYINNGAPYILDQNSVYQVCDLTTFKTKFNITTLDSQTDWINYLSTSNVPTVAFLTNIYNDLKSLNSTIIGVDLQNNSFDINSFNQIFTIDVQPYNSAWISSLIIELAIIVLFMTLAYQANKNVRLG